MSMCQRQENLRVLEKEDEGVEGSSSVARLLPGGLSKIHGFVAEWYSGCSLLSPVPCPLSSQSSKLGFLKMWGERRMEDREGMLDCRQLLLRLFRCCSR